MQKEIIKALTAFGICWAFILVVCPAYSLNKGINYANDRLTYQADSVTLPQILENLSKVAGLDVYIGKGVSLGQEKISIDVEDLPLEDVIKSILRGHNYAAFFTEDGAMIRLSSIKIFAPGKYSGDVVPLFKGNRTTASQEKAKGGKTLTVLVNQTGDVVTEGGLARKGVVAPFDTRVPDSGTSAEALQSPWFAMQMQAEREEMRQFEELQHLKKQIESASDAQTRQSLSMVYADRVARFQETKRAHFNKIEALKRFEGYGVIKEK